MEAAIDALVPRLGLTTTHSTPSHLPVRPASSPDVGRQRRPRPCQGRSRHRAPRCDPTAIDLDEVDDAAHAHGGRRAAGPRRRLTADPGGEMSHRVRGGRTRPDAPGLVGLSDPARPSASQALQSLSRRRASRWPWSQVTTRATACGHRRAGRSDRRRERVFTGANCPLTTPSSGELIDHDGVVVARVAPEQKLAIASRAASARARRRHDR